MPDQKPTIIVSRSEPDARGDLFWSRVAYEDGHLIYTGPMRGEYGGFTYGGERFYAHRFAYDDLHDDPVSLTLELDHTCRVKLCVLHTEPVTRRENQLRAVPFSWMTKVTHCPQRHAYSPENTYRTPRGKRVCRMCRRASQDRARYGYARTS